MNILLMYIILGTTIPLSPLFSQTIPEEQSNDIDTTCLIEFTLFPEIDSSFYEIPVEINLEFDMKQFYKEKFSDEYIDALLSFARPVGQNAIYEVKIKSRGEFRREHCFFPPIRINLKKARFENDSLDDSKSLKLVTHCKNSNTYEQYLLKEYLTYRMYNILTDYSYRVRLFTINYIDSQGKSKPFTKHGFIIESHDHLANRIDAYRFDRNISSKQTDYDLINLLFIYQYMIGNTDWAVPVMHNIRLFKLKDLEKFYPVAIPYDFDYSGMVNAYYAIPDEMYGIKTVRERKYKGYCIPESDFYRFFDEFIKKKDELYSLVKNFNLLEKYHQQEMIKYLDDFFTVIENPNIAKQYIIESCRQY